VEALRTLSGDFRAAFGSFWSVFGIAISSVAIFNFLNEMLTLEAPALLAQLLVAFRSVFHPIANFLLGWTGWQFPAWAKDALVVWLALGGATMRTFLILRRRLHRVAGRRAVELRDAQYGQENPDRVELLENGPMRLFVNHFALAVVMCLASLIAWPIIVALFMTAPVVYTRYDKARNVWVGGRGPPEASHTLFQYDHDLRITLAMQVLATVAVVTFLVILSAGSA